MGPTASGKTELAMQLVQQLPCDIISVDSVMVYRGMNIGSAKPDADNLVAAPHRLIDICDPTEAFSAACFRERALREMDEILARGRIPLLVGGTMLYFRALERGLSSLPSADPALRARLEAEAQEHGWQALHARLAAVDPTAAARIHINDSQRIQRALEVYKLTGEPLSAWFGRETAEPALPCRIVKVALMPMDRADLHRRIETRFRAMLEQGLIAEVEGLYRRGDLHAELPAMRAVGYRQVWEHLAGRYDYDTLVEKGINATRQFAKRQLTWLRSEPEEIRLAVYFDAGEEQILSQVLKSLAANAI
jgi:tRNA dimethylallyltransferase